MDHQTFKEQINAFSKYYRVVLWDMPGHGKSFPVDDQFSFSMVSKCLICLLEDLDNPDAVNQAIMVFVKKIQYNSS